MRRKKRALTPEEIIVAVARQEKKSVEEIRFSMMQAIRIGMLNPDPEVRAIWSKFPVEGRIPTPEEFLFYLPKIVDLSEYD